MKERLDNVDEALSNLVKEVKDNRQYSTSKFHELNMELSNNKLDVANTRYHKLKRSYEDLAETIGKGREKTGTTYVRWGRTTCPADTESVYIGYAGGSYYNSKGAAVSMLCLPKEPEWHEHSDGVFPRSGFVYGAEYRADPRIYPLFGKYLSQEDVPCTVCNNKQHSSSIMIPGKTSCHAGWTLEYTGYLMSGFHFDEAASDYYCVDKDPEALPHGDERRDGKLLYFVEARCGSLMCPPYKDGWELACVVCSK